MIFFEICEIFKITFFYRTPPVAASEERIAEKVQNFPCLYDKGDRGTKKKSEKERITWAGECLRLRQNYNGNLDLLKRCSEKFLLWLSLEKRLFINLSKENEHLHHHLSTTRKDSINLKWIPRPRTLRESAKLENNGHHRNI